MALGCCLYLEPLEDRTLLNRGTLDATFGSGGEVVTPFSTGADRVDHVAFQSGGKLVVVGSESVVDPSQTQMSPFPPLISDVFVARYDGQGRLDPTFGTDGKVVTDLQATTLPAATVAVQPDGKILVAGNLANGFAAGAEVVRYNADGSLDTTFGNGGKVLDGAFSGPTDVLVQTDGKILLDGTVGNDTLVVARYNADGSPDAGFGTGGKASLHFDAPGFNVHAMAEQPGGRIIVVGNDSGRASFLRFNADGSQDTSFGAGRPITVDMGFFPLSVAVQSDGKILAAGFTNDPINPATTSRLERLSADGTLDTSFGTNGEVATGDVIPQVVGIALQGDGRIILAGDAAGPLADQPSADIVAARYNADGSLDLTFGVSGRARADFGAVDLAAGLGIQPDGKIVVVGSTGALGIDTFVTRHTALARFLTDDGMETLPQRFVTQVYLNLLHRLPDATGLAAFTTLLANGRATPVQIVQAIEASAEYRALAVSDLYVRLLGRSADAFGLGVFTSFLAAGGTLTEVEVDILSSAEYAAHHFEINGNFPPTFLNSLYQDVLGRSPDFSGTATFIPMLEGGVSRFSVVELVLTSVEAEQRQIESLYQRFLGRTADPGGLTAFMKAVQQGVPMEAVVAAILGSAEYWQHL